MGFPSGNFSSANSGRLQVVFSAEITQSGGSDWGSGTNSLILRCRVGSGGTEQIAHIGLGRANAAILERDYVGGSGNVPVSVEYASHSFDGPATLRAKNIRISCRLYAT